MADLTITAANVAPGTSASKQLVTAGEAISQGQTVYLDSATSTYKLADANAASGAKAVVGGIALSSAAAAGQPLVIQTGGTITIGATVAVGTHYIASATPGGICPVADQTTGWYPSYLGIAITTTAIQLQLFTPTTPIAVP